MTGDARTAGLFILGVVAAMIGCARPEPPNAAPRQSVRTEADAILEKRCASCHQSPPGGRLAFSTVASLSAEGATRCLERIAERSMPPGHPLAESESSKLGPALCERARIDASVCREEYLGNGEYLLRTTSETLRLLETLIPPRDDLPKDRAFRIAQIKNELMSHNGPHQLSARMDVSFAVLYTLLIRELCADAESRTACEKSALSAALERLPPPKD